MRVHAPLMPQPGNVAAPLVQRECATCGGPSADSVCEECEEQDAERREADAFTTARGARGVPGSVGDALRSSGEALDGGARRFMQGRFGHDFSQVRVHAAGADRVGDETEVIDYVPPQASPQDAGTPAQSPPPPPPAPPAPACVQPVKWVHGSKTADHGDDGIRIDISWESSTGKLSDLSTCETRELVTYDPIPNPPFKWKPPNPTILKVPATAGSGQDTHSYPPGLKNGITNPRTADKMVAKQVYQFKCSGAGCANAWTDFPDEAYTLTRETFEDAKQTPSWRYKITKAGGPGGKFSYSREVGIPAP